MDRKEYERRLKERQEEHLKRVRRNANPSFYAMIGEPCMHDQCSECHGTGVRRDGAACVHMISCPCPKCTPRM